MTAPAMFEPQPEPQETAALSEWQARAWEAERALLVVRLELEEMRQNAVPVRHTHA